MMGRSQNMLPPAKDSRKRFFKKNQQRTTTGVEWNGMEWKWNGTERNGMEWREGGREGWIYENLRLASLGAKIANKFKCTMGRSTRFLYANPRVVALCYVGRAHSRHTPWGESVLCPLPTKFSLLFKGPQYPPGGWTAVNPNLASGNSSRPPEGGSASRAS